MKSHCLLLLSFILLSCNTKDYSKLPLFNNIYFQLEEGDTNLAIDFQIKNDYFSIFSTSNNKQNIPPLFRYIDNGNYSIYIGVPFNTSLEDFLSSEFSSNSMILSEQVVTSKNSIYRVYEIENTYYVEYVVELNDSLFYIITTTDSKEILDTKFSLDKIGNRLIQN